MKNQLLRNGSVLFLGSFDLLSDTLGPDVYVIFDAKVDVQVVQSPFCQDV